MALNLPEAALFFAGVALVAFAWERATRPDICGLCANPRPIVGVIDCESQPVGICAECCAICHPDRSITNV